MDRTQHFITMFAGHALEAIVDDGPVLYWRLNNGNPGDFNSVSLTVTPGGVILQRIDRMQAWTSDVPVSDFAGELDKNYLAQKFLIKRWTRASAEQHFAMLLRKLELLATEGLSDAAESAEELRLIRQRDTSMFDSEADWEKKLGQELDSLVEGLGRFDDPMIDASERTPPLAFEEDEIAYLAALHGRFRECFMEAYKLEDGRPVKREVG